MQVAEEGKINVELPVAGTVERSHRRLPHPAGGAHLAFIEYERRRFILRAGSREDARPHLLGAAEDLGDELPGLVRGRAVRGWALGLRLANLLHHGRRIKAQEVRDQSNDDAADANAAGGHPHPAPIFNVVTCALLPKVHAGVSATAVPGPLLRRDVVSERHCAS